MKRAALWLLGAALLAAMAWWRWPAGAVVHTDFYDLLPGTGDTLWQQRAARQAATVYDGQLVLLAAGDDTLAAQAFVDAAVASLGDARDPGQTWREILTALKAQRFNLLSQRQAQRLAQNPQALLQDFQRVLYSPLGSAALSQLPADPAGLWRGYVLELIQLQGDMPVQNVALASVQVRLHDAALLAKWRALKQQAAAQGLAFYATGAPLFAAAAKQSASVEMRTVGLASLLVLLLLLWRFLRSWRALALVLLCVGSGLVAGFLITVSALGSVHVLTLVFGATLIGVAADYAFHYLAHARKPGNVLADVLPGLRLSVISSGLAFALLLLLPFPGMRQTGLFMASGLLASFATVVLLYPVLYRPPEKLPALPRLMYKKPILLPYRVLLVVCAMSAAGLYWLGSAADDTGTDDVRNYYRPASDVEADRAAIAERLGNTGDSRFLLFYGDNEQQLAQREAQLADLAVPVYSLLVPSEKRQRENYELIKQLYRSAAFAEHLRSLGFDEAGIASVRAQLPAEFAPIVDVPFSDAPGLGQRLGCERGVCASWAPLGSAVNTAELSARLEHSEGVVLINPIADFNVLLSEYRSKVLLLLLAAAALAGLIGALLYDVKTALSILWLPLIACCGSLLFMAFVFAGLSLAAVLAALVVAGVSLDYAIFKALSAQEHYPKTLLAITLSSLTSIIAFGALMFSSTPFLSQFGLGIAVGLGIAYGLVWFRAGSVAIEENP